MKIVYQGKTKKGKEIIIRYLQKSDIPEMKDYINTLSYERTYIRMQGEQISLKEETKFIKKMLESIENKQGIQLLVICKDRLVGLADIKMQEKIEKHIGLFGITIAKEFRGEGIGKLLMKLTIDEAVRNLPDLELIKLGCFSNNTLALSMYRRFGFKEYGRLPGGVKLQDKYVDHIYMHLKIDKSNYILL